jgi:hypothetical protein
MTKPRWIVAVALVLVVVGLALRVRNLGATAFWVDEAESALDGLTILEHGAPVGRLFGQPMFQNTLLENGVTDWNEYSLRDASFGRHDLAVYHGWLPLYSIALAEKLGGIEPDPVPAAGAAPRVLHSADEVTRRSVIPRIPAIVFAALFLLASWRLGAALAGEAAGLAVLAVAALAARFVWFGQQARYYSAALALTSAAALALVVASRRGRWRDFVLLGLAAVALFHTHSLTCLLLAGAAIVWLPPLLRAPRGGAKLAVALAIFAAGSLPWALYAGFFDCITALPRAWTLLELPRDSFLLRSATKSDFAALAVAAAVTVVASLGRRLLPARAAATLGESRRALAFTALWFVLSALGFAYLIPAPSYSDDRAVLVAILPALLFAAVGLATLVRALAPKLETVALLAAVPLYLALSSQWQFARTGDAPAQRLAKRAALVEMIGALQHEEFTPGARIFATPNDHLGLAYYTGLPIQNVAPLRRSFFEEPSCDVWVLEGIERFNALPEDRGGPPIPVELGQLHVARDLARAGVHVVSPGPPSDPSLATLFDRQSAQTRKACERAFDRIPMLRGFPSADWLAFWPTYAYRFAPDHRRLYVELERDGDVASNYAPLLPRATARVLSSSWVILACRRDGRIPGR